MSDAVGGPEETTRVVTTRQGRKGSGDFSRFFPGLNDKVGRKLVQAGFLVLFLYPLLPVLLARLTYKPTPTFTSWLLPWDPLLFFGHMLHRDWTVLIIGAPLLLLALTVVLGRFFCGWVCPVGTVLDFIRPLARWQKSRAQSKRGWGWFPADRNGPVRYYLLVGILAGAVLSLQALGLLDPLVFFHRTTSVLAADAFALQRPILRMYLSFPLLFAAILALELWQPRFWCRHLCPLGGLLGFLSRWSLLNRRVSAICSGCGLCRHYCPMKAIPADARTTSVADCHLCLGCESVCPRKGISFGWTLPPAGGASRDPDAPERKQVRAYGILLSRRDLLGGAVAGAAGLSLVPLLRLAGPRAVIRPPGALSEGEFLRTCVTCQECVRVCPTGSLKPAFLEAGMAGIGTPCLVPRQGGCSLNPSCPHLCAQVCPVGAIRPIRRDQVRMGLASVDRGSCLAWDQGVKCLVCVEACPTGAAIAYHSQVTVDPARCTGCGRCEHACPVAGAAIHVEPLSET